jgi:protein-tyrosine phosphatase
MDNYNVYDLNRMTGNDPDHKISLMLDYTDRAGEEVADPYFTLNYDATWRDIKEGCEGLLTHCLTILEGDKR